MRNVVVLLVWITGAALNGPCLVAQAADLISHHGKIVTVDAKFSIAEAVAVRDGRIVKVGNNDDVATS